jgi:hypothetical protein
MHAWLLLATLTPASPGEWVVVNHGQGCVPCPAPVMIYSPCTPVYNCTPIAVADSVCVEKVVTAETTAPPKPESSVEQFAAVAEESELTAAGLNRRDRVQLAPGDLALDWGLANIGPGALYPTNNSLNGPGGFFPGGWGGGRNGNPGGPTTIYYGSQPPSPLPPGPRPQDPPGKVPEPGTILLLAAGASALARKRRRMRTA